MPKRFQGPGGSRFGSSEKDLHFLKISKGQHKLISYFLNNAARIYSYGLKVSENIEIKHIFQSTVYISVTVSIKVGSEPLSLFHSQTL